MWTRPSIRPRMPSPIFVMAPRLLWVGSGISLGHPVGATGARILATASRQLVRTGGRYLLETMCIGGGQGLAAIFEAA